MPITKSLLGMVVLLGGVSAVGVPMVMNSSQATEDLTKVEKVDESVSTETVPSGGGCKPIEKRVASSLLSSLSLVDNSENKDVDSNSEPNVCLDASIKPGSSSKIGQLVSNSEEKGSKGVQSLVNLVLKKFEEGAEYSTGGGDEGGSSGQSGEGNKSVMLTGSSNDGEYLMGKEDLKISKSDSTGRIMVAKKESLANNQGVSVKIGGKDGAQSDNSPQLQIDKKELNDGKVTVEFRRSSGSKS